MGNLQITMAQFAEAVARRVGEQLGEGYKVEPEGVTKNNDVRRTALIILGGQSNAAPMLYLDELYRSYLEGMPMAAVCSGIVSSFYAYVPPGNIDVSSVQQFDGVKERIYCRLLNAGKNRELLRQTPHRLFQDLALVAYILFADSKIGEGTVTVSNGLLATWGIDRDTLIRCALQNTPKLGQKAAPMTEVLGELFDEGIPEGDISGILPDIPGMQLYVASNDRRSFGAAVMLDEEFLRQFSDRIGGHGFYILPSSIHEVLFLPQGGIFAKELRSMVREVNKREVAPEEVLSDNVYYYNRITGRVEIA